MYLTLGATNDTPAGWESVTEDYTVADRPAAAAAWETPVADLVGGQKPIVPSVVYDTEQMVEEPEAGFLGISYKWWLISLGATALLWYLGRDKIAPAPVGVKARVQ